MSSPRILLTLGLILLLIDTLVDYLFVTYYACDSIHVSVKLYLVGASVAGLFLGFVGGAMWVRMNKED